MKVYNNHKDMENLKQDVQKKFTEIRNALHMREKLLLRQADVIMQQTRQQQMGRGTSSHASEIREATFVVEMEEELLAAIRNFGRFQLENINLTLQDVYLKNEDYITPSNDHETMYKCLQQSKTNFLETHDLDNESEQPEAIVVDFSRNKSLIEHNAKHMNTSIINITLQEAKELIKKAKIRRETPIPPLNLEELDDELESSIAEAVSSLGHDASLNAEYIQSSTEDKTTKSSKKGSSNRFKPKITINNCNGTINLRNISNLTINCATEDSISAEIPFQGQKQDHSESPKLATQSDNELVSSSISNQKNETNENKSSGNSMTNTTDKSATVMEPIVNSADDSSTPTTTASSSNYSSSSSSRSQSKKHKSTINKKSQSSSQGRTQAPYPYGLMEFDDHDNMESHAVTCDFYNRLLKEIKNSLRIKRPNETIPCGNTANNDQPKSESTEASESKTENTLEQASSQPNSNCSSYISLMPSASLNTTNTTVTQPAAGRRLVLKNFENLRIVLEANSSDEESFHPVQIEQWLAEIISETDLEPMQNTDILEHSKIHNETK